MSIKEFVITKEEEKSINKWFPLIRQIKSSDIRQKVIEVWTRIWRESGLKDLTEAPTLPNEESEEYVDLSLVSHTNSVTKATLIVAEQFQKEHKIPINFDVLLAAAILHDVDKPVILKRINGRVEISELGKIIPHGSYGAHIALEVGLPLEVAHVICTHSRDCTQKPNTVEGILIYHEDLANIRSLQAAHKRIRLDGK